MKKNFILFAMSLSLLLTPNLFAGKKMTQNTKRILQEAQKEIKAITPQEFKDLIDEDEDFIQLDVRENNQYGHGEIWTMEIIKLTRGYVE